MAVARRERARTTRVTEMADFAGVSEQAFRRWMALPGFPKAPDGSVCLWDLAVWRNRLDAGTPDETELGDVDSPGLERYRLARAEQEEIKLRRMRGESIAREDLQAALMETASVLKEAGDRMVRVAGNDVAEMLNDAWTEVETRLERLFGDDRTGGTTGEPDGATE